MFIDNPKYTIVENNSNEAFQALWIQIKYCLWSNYRQHNP